MHIAIVGLGPTGLTVLERLLRLAAERQTGQVQITIFEPNEPGVGVHGTNQNDFLRLNTVACQLTMFPDKLALGGARETRDGPNFHEWCLTQHALSALHATGHNAGEPPQPTDFLPRRLLGRYLRWTFDKLIVEAPPNVAVSVRKERVRKAERAPSGDAISLESDGGTRLRVDRVVITTGHASFREESVVPGNIVLHASSLPDAVAHIQADKRVGIEGFGLTAMDVIASLTLGRGGVFYRCDNGRLKYRASGAEPRMVLYSRSGLPFRARPDLQRDRVRHRPVFLTAERIIALRRLSPRSQIDFRHQVLPLMLLEMAAAYYICAAGHDGGQSRAREVRDLLLEAAASGMYEPAFATLAGNFGPFDPEEALGDSVPEMTDGVLYREWARSVIESDLLESEKGSHGSPLKAAIEVWRDLRDNLRLVVDHDGLTDASRRVFYAEIAPLINRLVAGPQKERHEELLALLDAGVVIIADGYGSSEPCDEGRGSVRVTLSHPVLREEVFDYVVRARIAPTSDSSVISLLSPLHMATMHHEAPVIQDAYCFVDECHHPRGLPATIAGRIWVLGPPIEGTTYYNHYVPSGGGFSRAFCNAHRVALECLDLKIDAGRSFDMSVKV